VLTVQLIWNLKYHIQSIAPA